MDEWQIHGLMFKELFSNLNKYRLVYATIQALGFQILWEPFWGSVLFVHGNPSEPVLGFCEKQSWEPILTKIEKKGKYTNVN